MLTNQNDLLTTNCKKKKKKKLQTLTQCTAVESSCFIGKCALGDLLLVSGFEDVCFSCFASISWSRCSLGYMCLRVEVPLLFTVWAQTEEKGVANYYLQGK